MIRAAEALSNRQRAALCAYLWLRHRKGGRSVAPMRQALGIRHSALENHLQVLLRLGFVAVLNRKPRSYRLTPRGARRFAALIKGMRRSPS
jgi:DNA-binding transcriptional ArsR family regulator